VAGAALCGLIWVSNPLLAVILMIIIGAGKGALTPIAWGVMQEITPRFMVGRVLSLYTTGAMVAAIAGMTTFGWITQEFGERTSIVGIGLMLFATSLTAVGLSWWVHGYECASPVAAQAHGFLLNEKGGSVGRDYPYQRPVLCAGDISDDRWPHTGA
jgi:MFS family permease